MRKFLQILAVSGAALAAAVPAQATVVTFDQGLDTSGVFFSPLLGHGDLMTQEGFAVGMYSTKAGAQAGDFVGALVDGNDVANTCFGVVCPTNNPTQFLAALDDGLPEFSRLDGGAFRLKQFDASFIAVLGATVPPVSLYMRLAGYDAAGDLLLLEDFLMPGPVAGAYSFSTYQLSAAFSSTDLHYLDFIAYACDASGNCNRGSNRAQFGLDNVTFIPEPSSLALAGLAFAGLMTLRRRQNAAA